MSTYVPKKIKRNLSSVYGESYKNDLIVADIKKLGIRLYGNNISEKDRLKGCFKVFLRSQDAISAKFC
jgi:hypothetical protein